MKNIIKIFILLFSISIIILNSCKKDPVNFTTTPKDTIPEVHFNSNLTIAQLKSVYSAGLILIGDTLIVSGDTIIKPVFKGVVSANDLSGNIYKTLYIQDYTGGIQIPLDRIGLYNTFKVGQEVFIKCSGLYLGSYGGIVQLGYINNGFIGRIPDILIDSTLFCNGLPSTVTPITRTITSISGNDMNMLIKLEDVHFLEAGSTFSTSVSTTNRTILDSLGNSLILRTSNNANFAANLMPSGQGDIVGIISSYNGTNQLYIRDLDDIKNWDSTITYPVNIIDEKFVTSLGTFTQYSVIGTQIWSATSYAGKTFVKISGYESGYFANEDWLVSPSVNFDNYTLETLSFETAMNYGTTGDGSLRMYTSNNYSGSGDPNLATWNEITTATLSAGSWAFTSSGDIDLSGITGTNVHIAFKYTCGTTAVPTWELTAIKLSAKPN